MKKILLLALLLTTQAFAAWPHKDISQAVFAKSVEERAPIDIITEIDNSVKKVYFFTNIRHLKGDRITHRWLYKSKVKAEISFDIKGNRWRVWSSKNLWHRWTGEWTVEVVNQNAEILLTKTFEYKKS
ncbi:DUF2914 domain-containing protein [Bathymodiolus septemdierum thioautotrophic gill symbiont]|uniref:DUF2914 domain-containing protein n=1 Tax=endosymbiont of Bathymodiolus septemdierum str. Myojin knoll TaxID=1303921 RepID=A0A0P0UQE2_9GAMM|nr:DUF2914 domain-containing protein [Bathymodiolus septemdierum thioautotrophic gill symbiont]BAS67273.1 conserved hypothetical protein [endosymbiont of Bathymodiolus septemdierum str. Myojin knoll]